MERPECKPLKWTQVPKTLRTIGSAFRDGSNDPVSRYVSDTPDYDKAIFFERSWKALHWMFLSDAIRRNAAWTVDGGDSIIEFAAAHNSLPYGRRILERIISFLKISFMGVFYALNSREQKLRTREWHAKFSASLKNKIGNRLLDMMYLDILATHPAKRGRGYATALVKLVTAKADIESRAVWLHSSNVDNTGFYESLGFSVIDEFTVGENNPTWQEPPVVSRVMVREPRTLREKADEKDGLPR
ncbi:hypothetical protein AcW1_000441 [Taiwanofungus camphoratus]|nr:hypothetical protein AcW1_000441 [Antrodia cinnamomea]